MGAADSAIVLIVDDDARTRAAAQRLLNYPKTLNKIDPDGIS